MIPAIDVWTEGLTTQGVAFVGRAHFNLRRGSISCSFSYDETYLLRPDAFPIDPALPLNSATHTTTGLPGCFRDSSPDRWGRHLIARSEMARVLCESHTRKTLDEVDYLLGVHDASRQGALRFTAAGSTLFLSNRDPIPPIVSLPSLINASNIVVRGEDGLQQLKELLDAGSGSLGGARPKASVTDKGMLILAKFSHPGDEWNVMAWEKTALDLASAARIETPQAKLIRIGKETVLLLHRFDRFNSLAEGPRVPYLSGITLLSSQDGDDSDYVEVAEALALFTEDAHCELASLFRRIVFYIAIHNTDDHLRNLGLLRKGRRWTLSPLFDANPNPTSDSPRVTSIYGESGKDEARVLASCVEIFDLCAEEARDIVMQVLHATKTWESIARRNGCTSSEISMFKPVINSKVKALKECFDT